MFRVFLFIFVFALFLFAQTPSQIQDKNASSSTSVALTPQEMAYISKNPLLSAGSSILAPYVVSENGIASGIIPEILKEIVKSVGLQIDFKAYKDGPSLIQGFTSGDIMALGVSFVNREGILRTDPYLRGFFAFYTRKDDKLSINSLDDLSDKRVAEAKESPLVSSYLSKNPKIIKVSVQSMEESLNMLIEGKVDVAIASSSGLPKNSIKYEQRLKLAKIITELPVNVSIGVNQKHAELLPILNKAIAALPSDKKKEIENRWLNTDLSKDLVILPSHLQKWLDSHRVAKVGIDLNWAPFEFAENGEYKGLAVDLLKLAAKKVNLELKVVENPVWEEYFGMLERKEIDIISSLEKREELLDKMLFSSPHTIYQNMIITRDNGDFVTSVRDFKGKKIGIVQGYFGSVDRICNEQNGCNKSELKIVEYKNIKDLLIALSRGDVDICMETGEAINYYTKKLGITNLKISGQMENSIPLHVAVRSDYPELVEILNIALASITEAQKDEIYRKWIGIKVDVQIDYSLLWKVVAGALFLIAGFIYWNRKLAVEITRRKEIEAQLRIAQQRAMEASNAKSEFLANMSHEIRTPMNAIIGMNTLALRSMDDKTQSYDFVKKALNSAKMLLGVINDILDFSKIEAGKLEIENLPFNIKHISSNINDLFGFTAKEKGLIFSLEIDERIPEILIGDPLRITQIITNLTSNAIKFTSIGSVRVNIKFIEKTQDSYLVSFQVMDTGRGIAPENIKLLFEQFTQEDNTISRKYGGTGLGLAISKQLALMMGGTIKVDSEMDKGSKFSLELPLIEAKDGISSKLTPQYTIGNPKILVVDDDSTTIDMIKESLGGYSFDMEYELSGTKALEMVKSEEFDLVLIDFKLDDMNGIELLKKIKNLGLKKMPQAVMISVYDDPKVKSTALECGFREFISKPLNASTLLDSIMASIGNDFSKNQDTHILATDEILKKSRILLVEDNEMNQEVAINFLSEMVGEIESAWDGKEALEKVFGQRVGYYDLVLLDIHMPILDGYAVARAIRADSDFSELPIVAMSANAMKSDVQKCIASGMNDHIPKPFEVHDLYNKLKYWIGKRKGGEEVPPHQNIQEKQQETKEADSPPSLDTEAALKRLMNKKELYHKMLKMFVDGRANDIQKTKELLDEGKKDEAKMVAHSLKGVANGIGAFGLGEMCKELESKIETATEESVLLLEAIQKEMESVIAQVKSIPAKEV